MLLNQEVNSVIEDYSISIKEKLLVISKEQKRLEEVIIVEQQFLNSTPVGLKESLINSDGYPRGDIDIWAIRIARNKLNCAITDLKYVQELMHRLLVEYHVNLKRESFNALKNTNIEQEYQQKLVENSKKTEILESENHVVPSPNNNSFLTVTHIEPNSPASESGMQECDDIITFGNIHYGNFKSMLQISEYVKSNENNVIPVLICSKNKVTSTLIREITLVPHKWSGQGLLGCTIIPL